MAAGTPALLGVPGSGREGAGMGEVAGCMDLEEAGLSRSLLHIPAAWARGALRWAGSVPGGCGRRDAAPAPQQVGLRGACATPHSGRGPQRGWPRLSGLTNPRGRAGMEAEECSQGSVGAALGKHQVSHGHRVRRAGLH